MRHLGKAESRSGTEVPVYPRRTCRRRRRGIRVRVRARALAASHGECRHGCGQRPSRGVPSGVASSRAGALPPPPPAAHPGGREPCPTCPLLPALKGPCGSQPPPSLGEAAPLKGAAPAHPHLHCLGCTAGGGGLGGTLGRCQRARPPSSCGHHHLAREGAAGGLLKRQQYPVAAMTRAWEELRDASPGASGSPRRWPGRGQNDAMLCGACLVNPSTLPPQEPGGGGEGVSVKSGRRCWCVPMACLRAGADPGNSLAGMDQAQGQPSGLRCPVPGWSWKDVSSLMGLRVGTRWRGDHALLPVGV